MGFRYSYNELSKYRLSFDAHFQLVTIHSWVDGNGRTSSLVMNHLQYEFGLIPSKVVKDDKAEYIQSLIDASEQDKRGRSVRIYWIFVNVMIIKIFRRFFISIIFRIDWKAKIPKHYT